MVPKKDPSWISPFMRCLGDELPWVLGFKWGKQRHLNIILALKSSQVPLTHFKVRARSLRKKEASKKQTETLKTLATATTATPAVKCVDEGQVSDPGTGFAIPGAPIVNAQSSISTTTGAVAKKKVYSVKIEENIESNEAESRWDQTKR